MVFTLISALKDNAEQLIVDRLREVERVQERAKRREEEEEQRKFEGEKVTRESFGRWRGRFMAEVEGEREEGKAKGEGKLTGRQLWEGGLVGRGEEDDGEGAKELVGGVERPGVGE